MKIKIKIANLKFLMIYQKDKKLVHQIQRRIIKILNNTKEEYLKNISFQKHQSRFFNQEIMIIKIIQSITHLILKWTKNRNILMKFNQKININHKNCQRKHEFLIKIINYKR